MEVRQAMADLAEVRGRLATVQRFDGYSSAAASASGIVALAAGAIQFRVAPHPRGEAEIHAYLVIWLTCLVLSLAVNYGAIVAWRTRNRGNQARAQIRSVGMSILPALAAGGVITLAIAARGLVDLLPGLWCATYALGLFASRALVPRYVVGVAVFFGAVGALLLLVPAIDPLAWWTMPFAFALGQLAIGEIVRREGNTRT